MNGVEKQPSLPMWLFPGSGRQESACVPVSFNRRRSYISSSK